MNKFEQIIEFNTESIGVQSCLEFEDIIRIKRCSKQLNVMNVLPIGTLIYRGDLKLLNRVKDQINKLIFSHSISTSTIIKDALKICPYIKEIKIARMSVIDLDDESFIGSISGITYNKTILERELNEHLKNIRIIACNCYVSESLLNNNEIIHMFKCSKCGGNNNIFRTIKSLKHDITKEVTCNKCKYSNYSTVRGLFSLVSYGKSDKMLKSVSAVKISYPKHKKENFISKHNKKFR